ncbi:MAG: tRNA 4-thiouridine(8) synthase ThiI [Lentisphaerae bacterium]|nr:tRNA 4-thiouridine(8) synthase ThiI [Lentisphaerota bacterium]
MYNCIICRYHEIATKGNNRNMFEKCLVENIRHALREIAPECRVKRIRGRVWIEPGNAENVFAAEILDAINVRLADVFGLESYSPAVLLPVDMDVIRETALKLIPQAFEKFAGKIPKFRIRARRSNKRFPMTSREIEIDLVSAVAGKMGSGSFKIDLDEADITLGCEVRDEFSALYLDIFRASGGLPVGSNPRVLTLLSGGIDSPVAAWQIMKRGSPTDFITFHSAPYTPPETVDKVRGIAARLNRFQRKGRLFIVNLAEFQKAVRDNCAERLRTVLYRRAMFRIAEAVARREDCKALVTGEALGQVASQTVANMDTINRAIDMLVLRPLVGADKLEAIAIAEKIGTMKQSSVQVPDSCTVFAPSNPATSAPVDLALKEEAKIPGYAAILEKIIDDIEIDA